MASLNTYRQLSINETNTQKSLEKLSSGLRINKAGDDAAGLAISEKMRGQIRGLDMATRNAQDATSMLNTAEGNLNETHSILQRMKELATQASNDTNVGVDRGEIQKEINQLTSEINRIGNTTEFNTQKLLMGDGSVNLASSGYVTNGTLTGGAVQTTTEATQTTTIAAAAAAGDTATFTLNGIDLKVTFTASASNGGVSGDNKGYNVTSTTANVAIDASPSTGNAASGLRDALQQMIDKNDMLKGNYVVSGTGDDVIVSAVKGGAFAGANGSIGAFAKTGTGLGATAAAAAVGTTTPAAQASTKIDLTSITTNTALNALVGKGFTIAGKQIQFYNANLGDYTGSAIGINIGDALADATGANKPDDLVKTIVNRVGTQIDGIQLSAGTAGDKGKLIVTAAVGGLDGNNIAVADGGIQKEFKATFQIGANMGQSMTIDINDMRAQAIKISGSTAGGAASVAGAVFTAALNVTNGTDDTNVEYALDVSDHDKATAAIKVFDNAIQTVSAERSKLGAYTNRLEHTINNLGTSSENMTAAESRIRDVDMAKEMMSYQKNNILQQAAQAMLAQANQQPQGVLQLLR